MAVEVTLLTVFSFSVVGWELRQEKHGQGQAGTLICLYTSKYSDASEKLLSIKNCFISWRLCPKINFHFKHLSAGAFLFIFTLTYTQIQILKNLNASQNAPIGDCVRHFPESWITDELDPCLVSLLTVEEQWLFTWYKIVPYKLLFFNLLNFTVKRRADILFLYIPRFFRPLTQPWDSTLGTLMIKGFSKWYF